MLTARLTATHNGLVQILSQVGQPNGQGLLTLDSPTTPSPEELLSTDIDPIDEPGPGSGEGGPL